MFLRRIAVFPALVLFAAILASAHYTWLIRTHYSSSGDTVYLEFGHGHDFPKSEEAPGTTSVKAWLATPDGARKEIDLQPAERVVKLEAALPSKALTRVYYERDRGIRSQTADGWKEGGREKHPNAKVARRFVQYGMAWVGFTGTTNNARPLGLELELNYESGLRGRLVRVWRNGKPVRDIEVIAVLSDEKEIKLGKTDREGYVKADSLPERAPVLFSVSLTEKAPKGASYDDVSLNSTLAVPVD